MASGNFATAQSSAANGSCEAELGWHAVQRTAAATVRFRFTPSYPLKLAPELLERLAQCIQLGAQQLDGSFECAHAIIVWMRDVCCLD
jgi:hypothetical protein